MKIIEPYVILEDKIEGSEILKKIERIGRVCYKSENNIKEDSAERFIQNIIKSGHESVLEHVSISVRVICDRGVSHEIVRHRVASYSQESTRYCNYSNDKFGNELTFIKPCWFKHDAKYYLDHLYLDGKIDVEAEDIWLSSMYLREREYLALLEQGSTPEQARSILPNSLKTEIVMTMNLREWRHFFKLRCAKAAHPQAREIANMILKEFKEKIPVIFNDIEIEESK